MVKLNKIGIIGSVALVLSLVFPWWSFSVTNYNFKISLFPWGIDQTGTLPGIDSIPLPGMTLAIFAAFGAVILLAIILGFVGSFWKRWLLIIGGALALLLCVGLAGILYMGFNTYGAALGISTPLGGIFGGSTLTFGTLQYTLRWGLEPGWFLGLISAVLMFVAFFKAPVVPPEVAEVPAEAEAAEAVEAAEVVAPPAAPAAPEIVPPEKPPVPVPAVKVMEIFCPRCGLTTTESVQYCFKCGTRLVEETNVCLNCGFKNPLFAEYCGKCGGKIRHY